MEDHRPPDGAPAEDQLSIDMAVFTEESADDPASSALPGRLESWRRRSATGAILTGMAFGLREVFEPNPEQPSIVMETSGDPPTDLPVEAELGQVPARHSVVSIRPWLLPNNAGESETAEERQQ